MLQEAKLRPTSTTLIVVPFELLEHWYEQFYRHGILYHFALIFHIDKMYDEYSCYAHLVSLEHLGRSGGMCATMLLQDFFVYSNLQENNEG